MQDVKGVLPRRIETLLALTAQLVQADTGKRADQGKSRGERKQQGQHVITDDHSRKDKPDNWIDQTEKCRVRGHGGEIGKAAGQRIFQVRDADLANYGRTGGF